MMCQAAYCCLYCSTTRKQTRQLSHRPHSASFSLLKPMSHSCVLLCLLNHNKGTDQLRQPNTQIARQLAIPGSSLSHLWLLVDKLVQEGSEAQVPQGVSTVHHRHTRQQAAGGRGRGRRYRQDSGRGALVCDGVLNSASAEGYVRCALAVHLVPFGFHAQCCTCERCGDLHLRCLCARNRCPCLNLATATVAVTM